MRSNTQFKRRVELAVTARGAPSKPLVRLTTPTKEAECQQSPCSTGCSFACSFEIPRDTTYHNIHAGYQGQVAVYSILDGMVLAGELPPNKHKLVVAWIEIHHEDLLADWNLAVNGKRPFPIKGLDQ
jgi:hypothetical protein